MCCPEHLNITWATKSTVAVRLVSCATPCATSEQIVESAISGVGRVAEETQHAHGIVEAAIAEATSVRG